MNDTGNGYLLNSADDLAQIARDAANRALRLGADQVIASVNEVAGIVMRARGGAFERAVREGNQVATLKVFDRGRTGTATTAALDARAIETAVERAIAIARTVEPDTDAGPPEDAWIARDAPSIALFEPSGLSAQDLGALALEIEAAGTAAGKGAVRVGEAAAASVDAAGAIALGRDFDRTIVGSRHDIWCTAIAERDGVMAQDGWSSSDRRRSQLLPASAVGAIAAERARRKLGGVGLSPQTCPVLLDAPVAATLVDDVVAALSGRAQFQGATFLAGGVGVAAMAAHVDLHEDPFEPFGLASGACDSEGVASVPRAIVTEGCVEGLFLSCLHARKLGLRPTGSADGPRNLRLTSRTGAEPLNGLLQRLGRGLWVTELIGGAVDPVSGTYSKAAAGFWVENGEVLFPVQDITIAGDLPVMLRNIVAIGGDVHRRGAVRSGSVLIEEMRVSGR